MKIILTNLSNDLYKSSRLRLNDSARKFGIENVRSYDFEEIKSSSFYTENKRILDQPAGVGYWLWKPYIIIEAMKELADGDVVVYADAGLEIIGNLNPLIQLCIHDQPILLFGNGDLLNYAWTKRDCFVLMNCDDKQYWYGLQCDAAFTIFRKSPETERFLEEWLAFARDERILTDIPNTCGKRNLPGFIDHRRDQSILSLLAIKYGLNLFRVPSQFGNHYKSPEFRVANEFNAISQRKTAQVDYYANDWYRNSPYFQLLYHHRGNNKSPKNIVKPGMVKRFASAVNKRWGIASKWYYLKIKR